MSNLSDVMSNKVCLPEKIPVDWIWVELTQVCRPKQWKTISSSEMTMSGYPVFGANGYVGFYTEYNHVDETIAITCRGNTCGTINRIPAKTYITGNSMALDDVEDKIITQDYLYHSLTHRSVSDAISGSAQPQITGNSLKQVRFPLAPLLEQQKIAAILTSVDDVIEKTQAQIDKLKDLKSGMMQELLTKGVGIKQGDSANGKSYIPHSEFKDSPVGRIPKSWEVVKLGDTGKWRGGGTPSKTNKEFWSGSIPWVSPKDMKLDLISRTQDHVSAKAIKESSTNLIPKGSLLMVVRSGILQHTLPVAIAGCDLTVNQDIKALTVSERYDTRFIFHYLKAHNHKVLRATLKAGNTVESIDFNEFSKFVIPSPPFEEQVKIADLVDSVANKISSKVSKLNQTSNLKKALMQDLLTGKVRVKVDNHLVVV